MKKIIILIIVLVCLLLLAYLGLNIYYKAPVATFYLSSHKEFAVPGLSKGFIPNGIAYKTDTKDYLLCGYSSKDEASPLYVVNVGEEETKTKKITLLNEDNTPFTAYAGGIAVYKDYVYIAGGADGCIYVFSYPALCIAQNDDNVACLGSIPVEEGMNLSYATISNEKLIVGETYTEETPTAEEHRLETTSGAQNNALAYAFAFSEKDNALFGVSPKPCEVYSLPNNVQGLAFYDGRVYVSTSSDLEFSHVYSYSVKATARRNTTYKYGKKKLPLHELDAGTLVDDLKFPPAAEGIEFINGKMYTIFSSNTSFVGKFTSGKWCYSTEVTKMW